MKKKKQKKSVSTDVSPDFKKALLEELKQTKEENKRLKKALNELVMDRKILRAANEILKKRGSQGLSSSQKRFYRKRKSKK